MFSSSSNRRSSNCTFVQLRFAAKRCYAPLPSGANSAPQTSWLDFAERKGWETGKRGKESARGKNISLHPFNGPLSGTTRVSPYQKGKTNLDFTEARDSEWQWHQLGHVQVCTSLQPDNHASTSPLSFFYRPDALPAAQPTASKH